VAGSLRGLVPDDHILARVDRVLDLGWLRSEVEPLSCAAAGRPGIDPEVAVRLMLAGLLLGIVHDRRRMRAAPVDVAIRWFIGYGLHEAPPDHASLTRIRQRWGGAERFRAVLAVLARTAQSCVACGGHRHGRGGAHRRHAGAGRRELGRHRPAARRRGRRPRPMGTRGRGRPSAARRRPPDGDPPAEPGPRRAAVCTTDPDATLVKDRQARRSGPADKQHTAVDGRAGVVLDVAVTTGAAHETTTVEAQLDAVPTVTGRPVRLATMDAAYAITRVFAALEGGAVEAVAPTKAERPPRGVVPVRRFKLDARNRIVRGPRKRILRPHGKPDRKGFQAYRASVTDRRPCPLRAACIGGKVPRRAILLHKDHPALPRARRKHARWGSASAPSTPATASAPKASTARPRPGTGSPAPSGAAEPTCGSRPT
jgi:Transposase domain (DUF772)/Transposase DDE domain